MRFLAIVSIVTVLAVTTSAQAPGAKPKPTSPPAPPIASKPVGNLAQVMRGILFPNANILFDVQSRDPETFGKKEEGTGASSTFSGIYTGWQVVENAAIALDESARLLEVQGRLCQNGKPVPIDAEGLGALRRRPAEGVTGDAQGRAVEEQRAGQRHDQRGRRRVRELPHEVSRRRPALHALTKGLGLRAQGKGCKERP